MPQGGWQQLARADGTAFANQDNASPTREWRLVISADCATAKIVQPDTRLPALAYLDLSGCDLAGLDLTWAKPFGANRPRQPAGAILNQADLSAPT